MEELTIADFEITVDRDGPKWVLLFRRWVGYQHPVRPQGPLTIHEALESGRFCRAWYAGEPNARQMVLFEAVELRAIVRDPPHADDVRHPAEVRYFDTIGDPSGPAVGAPLLPAQAAVRSQFFRRNSSGLALVEVYEHYSYRYEYHPDGALARVRLRNPEGESVLSY